VRREDNGSRPIHCALASGVPLKGARYLLEQVPESHRMLEPTEDLCCSSRYAARILTKAWPEAVFGGNTPAFDSSRRQHVLQMLNHY
jgi:hypothetical protein